MVYLPEGKMKSREGTVVDADNLIAQMTALAKEEIESRIKDPETRMPEIELMARAQVIALGAIKFYMLKQKPTTDIYFDPKESISFEGNTGPYCLYTYARSKSILRAGKTENSKQKTEISYEELNSAEERNLIRQLEAFPEIIKRAAEEYNPALITTFIFETCQAFNTFYTKHQVMKAESEIIKNARLHLVEATAQVIKNGLSILGIETVEEM
jgi:arginyl-tRNA synthetase